METTRRDFLKMLGLGGASAAAAGGIPTDFLKKIVKDLEDEQAKPQPAERPAAGPLIYHIKHTEVLVNPRAFRPIFRGLCVPSECKTSEEYFGRAMYFAVELLTPDILNRDIRLKRQFILDAEKELAISIERKIGTPCKLLSFVWPEPLVPMPRPDICTKVVIRPDGTSFCS